MRSKRVETRFLKDPFHRIFAIKSKLHFMPGDNNIEEGCFDARCEDSSCVSIIRKRMRQRRTCFLTGTRIGLPAGFFVALKVLFVIVLCVEYLSPSGYIILDKRDDEPPSKCVSTSKKQLVALLLSIFLGELGVDQFYIGNIGLGIGKLLTCEAVESGGWSMSF